MANTTLDLVSLDFATQKQSLIASLQAQDRFKDYDFNGSDLSVLIDLLSFNTFKNGFYLNMALSEGFIDSAQLRNNVLSHAKELNYLPRSARSAKATVQVSFSAIGTHQPYVVPKGSSFTAQIKNKSFIFSIPETLTVASANTSFAFTTDIYEGAYVKESFIFDTSSSFPRAFKLSNVNADTDSIVVNVFEDSTVTGTIYQRAISLLDLNDLSQVYFVQTDAVDGNYEILFGDGIVGYQPKNGALITIDYRVSSGTDPNGAGKFTINFDPTTPFGELTSNMTITTLAPAMGGDTIEDIETTRFYAPRWFQTQERAVTPTDYEVLLKAQFPEIHSLNAYGGEQLTPPQFGKVVIALSIANVQGIPASKQQQYYNFIKSRCTLTIQPIFITPQFSYIQISSVVRYNVNVTNETINRIQTIVMGAIQAFNDQFLNDFNVTFRLSKFQAWIDDCDPSIVSNLTNISVYQKIYPLPMIIQSIVLQFAMPLVNDLPPLPLTHPLNAEKCMTSSTFSYKGETAILECDNVGNINIVKPKSNQYSFVQSAGTINYDTGVVSITNLQIDSYDGDALYIYVRPRQNDVSCSLNTILVIEPQKIALSIEQIRQ
jgi:hypothetical protein